MGEGDSRKVQREGMENRANAFHLSNKKYTRIHAAKFKIEKSGILFPEKWVKFLRLKKINEIIDY